MFYNRQINRNLQENGNFFQLQKFSGYRNLAYQGSSTTPFIGQVKEGDAKKSVICSTT